MMGGSPRLEMILLLAAALSCGPTGLSAAESVDAAGAPNAAAYRLARRIDEAVAARWRAAGVEPAPLSDDATFLRRVWLDLAGKIPTASEVRAFEADPALDKRRRIIDRLLDEPTYVRHFANVWRGWLLPETESNQQLRYVATEFEAWLRAQLDANTPYDELVRRILMVPLNARGSGAFAFYSAARQPTPTAFYAAKEVKAENLAAATARIFLGMRVDCAQCHDHPFADWKREQFWAYAAYYQGLSRRTGNPFGPLVDLFRYASADGLTIDIPDTELTVKAAFLDGSTPVESAGRPRRMVANWITHRDNPFFARATANRMWGYLFGVGLVDPIDDLDRANPPSHPELLDDLAAEFVSSGFDLKHLLRAITYSRTYQLSSRQTDSRQQEPQLFARRLPKSMTGNQLLESLHRATGRPAAAAQWDPYASANLGGPQGEFLRLFSASVERPIEQSTSVLQALALMNGTETAEATGQEGAMLGAIAELPGLSTAQRIESLFLVSLSRRPTPAESARLVAYIEGRDSPEQFRAALGDVFWALLNSSEFVLIH